MGRRELVRRGLCTGRVSNLSAPRIAVIADPVSASGGFRSNGSGRDFAHADIYRSLLLILTAARQRELARYVAYTKAENMILHGRLTARVIVEPAR